MLGIRLSDEAERKLARYARESGRAKSVIARDWILERLEREELDLRIRDAAALHASERSSAPNGAAAHTTAAWLRWLDEEDGGYDWGPDGPPNPQ